MQTIRFMIIRSSLGTDSESKNTKNPSKDYTSCEGILESFETLKHALDVFLREFISSSVEDERANLKNFRISFVIKSKLNKKPMSLRNESDFSRLVKLVQKQEETHLLVIRLVFKKGIQARQNKRNIIESEADSKIKSLQNEIDSKRKELQKAKRELKESKQYENQLIGMMNKISLEHRPKKHSKTELL